MAERYLVTGAQGFLGRWVVAELLAGDPAATVVGVGRSARLIGRYSTTVSRGSEEVPAPLPAALTGLDEDPRYQYRVADLAAGAALAPVVAEVAPTVVVHAAAALRDEAWADLLAANVLGTAAVVDALAASPGARLVLVSSGSVYGAAPGRPLSEDEGGRPLDPYAVTKHAAENLARVAATRAGIGLWTARVFNLVGPGLQERHLAAALAARLCAIAVGALPPELHTGALTTTRDYIDVRDAAAAVALLARTAPPAFDAIDGARTGAGVVNVASGVETPVQRVLDDLVAELRRRRPLPALDHRTLPPRPADVARVVADVTRLRDLGFAPRHDLRGSLADMVDYYLDQVLA